MLHTIIHTKSPTYTYNVLRTYSSYSIIIVICIGATPEPHRNTSMKIVSYNPRIHHRTPMRQTQIPNMRPISSNQ